MKTIVKIKAADRKAGMTFGELTDFIHQVLTVAAISSSKIGRVRTTWRGTIRSLEIITEVQDD